MIKASELRIGNRLKPLRVSELANTPLMGYAISASHITYSEEELNNDWEAIPLTPDILGKCGFKPMQGGSDDDDLDYAAAGWRAYYSAPYMEGGKDHFLIWNNQPVGYLMDNYSSAPLKFLHQLQNLFFALTGEELTIKEPI